MRPRPFLRFLSCSAWILATVASPIFASSACSGGGGGYGSGASSSSSGGATSSGGTDASSSSGGGSSGASGSGGSTGSGSKDAAADATAQGSTPVCGVQQGASPCDLKTNTCCFNQLLHGQCIPKGQMCPMNDVSWGCSTISDCTGSGEVCCGVATTTTAQTACQTVAAGGSCEPSPATAMQASAQVCTSNAECINGQACIAQVCVQNSHLMLCGLQSAAPFNCVKQ